MTTLQSPVNVSLGAPVTKQDDANLDIMAITMTALRLVNPWTVNKTQFKEKIEPGSPQAKDRVISLTEVSCHDTPQDCWVVIYDRVYDVTEFIEEHPGGADVMLDYAGQDASTAFRSSGHSRNTARTLDRFLVGELPMHERMYRRPGGMRLSDIPD